MGWDAVKEITAGAARYQARYAGTLLRTVAVINQAFTSSAIAQAEASQVELVTRQRLAEYPAAYPLTNYEFDEALYAPPPVSHRLQQIERSPHWRAAAVSVN